uniref:STAS domain-containing protein n=1 Tax=Tetradesmus obliquus TaxID=3088 RepID=A0A383VST7_TETOB
MSLPRSIPSRGWQQEVPEGDEEADTCAIPIPSIQSASYGAFGGSINSRSAGRLAAAEDLSAASLSRSLAHSSSIMGSSFVAGHSMFSRQVTSGRSAGRNSLEQPAGLPRQGSVHLGLEPGLHSPLLDYQQSLRQLATSVSSTPHHPDAAAAAAYSGTATPHSVAAAEAGLAGDAAAAVGGVYSAPAAAAAAAAAGSGVDSGGFKRGKWGKNDVLYGIINAVVGIPTMISFAAIVYQDPTYKPLLGQLARIAFFSAAMHQLVFTIFSTLPFAVGQPQDVGLIFLSSMATGVAEIGRQQGLDNATVVGTALLTLTVATFVVGVMTLLVAKFKLATLVQYVPLPVVGGYLGSKFKLATLVQYVPLPVVGGYLGYVGYFCLAAGLGLGCNTTINSFSSWSNLFDHDALIKFIPTFAAALVLWLSMTRATSPWALPITLAAVPAAFHVYLLASGTTLAQAQDAGWVLKPEGKTSEQFWELYKLFNIEDWEFDGICLPALLRQIPKMLGLFFVVTFGSCLDVAAIQADMPFPIDFNSELGTVGLSNIIVGLSGSGYTGSYIFSQTIFSMRAGVSGYMHGAVIFALEAAIFLVPFQVVQYLPNFFFGALLMVFGIEIAGDWLVRSYAKVTRAEYVLLLATFIAIMELELEKGVAAGILMCTLYFAVTYARANMAAFKVLPSRSAAVRSYTESHVLEALNGHIATVAASGFLFFGSSVLMSNKVIQLAEDMVAAAAAGQGSISTQPKAAGPTRALSKDHARAAVVAPADTAAIADGGAAPAAAAAAAAAEASEVVGEHPDYRVLRLASFAVTGAPQAADGGASLHLDAERLALLAKQAPCLIILDFKRVLGIDATAAQTLGSLALVLRRMGVELVISRVASRSMRRLLVAHGIITGGSAGHAESAAVGSTPDEQQPLLDDVSDEELGFCRVFDTLNDAAKYAEDRLLAMAQAAGLLKESMTGLTLQQFFDMHCSQALLTSGVNVGVITAEVAKLGLLRTLPAGQRLFSFGDSPESFFLILKGVVTIQVNSLAPPPSSFRPLPAQLDTFEIERAFASGQGAVVGITDFVLQRLRSFQADTNTECTVLEVQRGALEVMVAEVPAVATALQAILLRDACLSEVYAYEVLERSARA